MVIKNFQSIEHLEFEVNGFTCITGKTNIGKSAIMRAISRSLLNDPVTGMVRKGQKFASVELSSEGWGFLWEKGEKDVNRYEINGKRYDKTGQVQLPEIRAMGFRSIEIGDDEIEPWWASQTRPVFLLDKSGPQITNFISEVSRLQVYQNAIVLAAKRKRRFQDEAKVKAEELARVQDKLNKITGLQSVERLEDEIEEQIRSLQEYVQRALTLEELHRDLEAIAGFLKSSKPASDLRKRVDFDDVEETVGKASALSRLHRQLDATAKKVIAMRPAEGLKAPRVPAEEVELIRKLFRGLQIVPLRAFVDRSEPAQGLRAPDLGEAEAAFRKLVQARRLSDEIRDRESALRSARELPAVPELPAAEVAKVRQLYACHRQMEELASEIQSLEAEEKRLASLKKRLEQKMAALRVCPECGQRLPEHTHAKGRKALSA